MLTDSTRSYLVKHYVFAWLLHIPIICFSYIANNSYTAFQVLFENPCG